MTIGISGNSFSLAARITTTVWNIHQWLSQSCTLSLMQYSVFLLLKPKKTVLSICVGRMSNSALCVHPFGSTLNKNRIETSVHDIRKWNCCLQCAHLHFLCGISIHSPNRKTCGNWRAQGKKIIHANRVQFAQTDPAIHTHQWWYNMLQTILFICSIETTLNFGNNIFWLDRNKHMQIDIEIPISICWTTWAAWDIVYSNPNKLKSTHCARVCVCSLMLGCAKKN